MLQGNLVDTAFTSVLQICNNENLTGFAVVHQGEYELGRVHFREGVMVRAETKFNTGVNAVNEMTITKKGAFRVTKGDLANEDTINRDFNFMLLNAIKYRDEIEDRTESIGKQLDLNDATIFFVPESDRLFFAATKMGNACKNALLSYIYINGKINSLYVKYDGVAVIGVASQNHLVVDLMTRKISQVW
ncbi:MAG: DUF4388 domain-containing protein [Verrucomicrobiae bacterium]|nr:DUF4388 domain-containing protein [Verrucomicrobiae bacterium]